MRAWLTRALAALMLLLVLALGPAPAIAQGLNWWLGGVAGGGTAPQPVSPATEPVAPPAGPDYEEWGRFATTAEDRIAEFGTPTEDLETLRSQIDGWRERFLQAQSANVPRVDTLRQQLAALGPAPEDGEPEELATRRQELTEQLARAQAPGIAAEEAFRRADGMIREIDATLRTRTADELLRRDPAPINPANWPGAVVALTSFTLDLWSETTRSWDDPTRRQSLVDALPLMLIAFLVTLTLFWKGRAWVDLLIHRIERNLPQTWWGVVELPLSLGQILVPAVGLVFLTLLVGSNPFFADLMLRGILAGGVLGAGLLMLVVLWIAGAVFPVDQRLAPVLDLSPERRAEGRLHLTLFGLILGAEMVLTSGFAVATYGQGVGVITYPVVAVSGLMLLRLGQLLRQSGANEAAATETPGFRPRALSLLGQGAIAIGAAGPVLGGVGYLALAQAMVYPAMATLGVLAVVSMLQRLVHDIFALITRQDPETRQDALIPVLISFLLVLVSLPILALIWGVRSAELWEFWQRFREGFRLGETRVSPTDFLIFGLIFGVGYGVTRLLQGALRTTILPKTRLDAGGRNAIVAGVGYIGIFLAALAAITSTGLDLSSIAIVAGALSVGIGFGLQNIVSNFVSGIILLIERPVAEGDWIEVGAVQGRVKAISVRSTRIETFDRSDVIVPNADLISGQVTNWTGFNLSGRLIVRVGVAYGTDTRKVERILREIAEAQPLVILTPPPLVLFVGFGADSLDFEIRMILRDVNFVMSVRSEVNHQIAARFQAEGIEIPFAQRDIWLRNPEVLGGAITGAAAGAAIAPAAEAPAELRPDRERLDDDTLDNDRGDAGSAPA